MPIPNPLVAIVLFTLAGVALAVFQVALFQRTVRRKFRILAELREENPAVGLVLAGLLISTGLIAHSAMSHNDTLLQSLGFGAIGAVLNVLVYHALDWLTPNWDLSEKIDQHSLAGGYAAFGGFVMIGLIVAGALS